MFEDLFNRLTASHLPKKTKTILPSTLLQPIGLVYGVITPRMQPQETSLVSLSKTMLLAAVLGMRDFKKDALVGSRIIDSEEIMPEPSCNDYAGSLQMQRSTNSISSGYDTDVRELEKKAFRTSSVHFDSDSDSDINFTGSENEGPATLCPNSRVSSASNSDSESDEESAGFKFGKTAADRNGLKSNAPTVLNTEIHFPILGENLEVANQVFTCEQLLQLKEFVEQLDEDALIKFVEERKITHRDKRLEILELDFDEEEKEVVLEDGSTVLIQESGREEEFFPGKSKLETRLFTLGQIEGFKQRLSNLKKAFNSLGSGDQTNLIQVISQVVPSFGNAIQALEICRSIKLQGQKSGLSGAMERELQLDASKESFAKAMFGALGRREIIVETGNWSQDQKEKFTRNLKV